MKLIGPPTLTLNGSAKPSMVLLELVMSQVDCGVPCFWFSHATGFAHEDEEESCAAAADADAAGARIVRAQAVKRAMAAMNPRNRLELRIAMRAIGFLDFAHAVALLTVPPHIRPVNVDTMAPLSGALLGFGRMPAG